ncbi:hypothetical protein Drose_22285 [Dactylosporangium roseum]|uniref:Uncharacterized protein n=1 Tax=Dactylosporangium roseum TaxID=47989 RepID=A0ABY5YYQ0_9ACTN|nr:hypothetical protein [Dactylosporangium roseum]UWZ33988.1 hypothetical protein Drose_22285 [Dactylosporangium roseum]
MTAQSPGRLADVSKIAVRRASSLGDRLLVVPAPLALRAIHPDAEWVLPGAPCHARFLNDRPGPVQATGAGA